MPNTFAKLQQSFSQRSSPRPKSSSGFARDGPASHTSSMSSFSSGLSSGKPVSAPSKGARRMSTRDAQGLRSEPGPSSDFGLPFPSPARSQRSPLSPKSPTLSDSSEGHSHQGSVWQRFSLTVHHGQRRPVALSTIMSSHLTSSPGSLRESILSPLYDEHDAAAAADGLESRYSITADALPRRTSRSEHRRGVSHTHDLGVQRTQSDTVMVSRLTSQRSAGSFGEDSETSSHDSSAASSYRDPPIPSSGCALIDAASMDGLATLVNALEWDRAARVAAQKSVDNWPNLGGLGPPPRRKTPDCSIDTAYSALQGKSVDSEAPVVQAKIQAPLKIKTVPTPPSSPMTPPPTLTHALNTPRSFDISANGEEQGSSDTATATPLLSGNRLSWGKPAGMWQVHEAPLQLAASPVDARQHFLSGEMRARIDGLRAKRQQERQRLASDTSQRVPRPVVAWQGTLDGRSVDSHWTRSPGASPKQRASTLGRSARSVDEVAAKASRKHEERPWSPLPMAARSLCAAITTYNTTVAEACEAMHAAALMLVLPDGTPPYASQARNATLPEPLLKSKSAASLVSPEERPRLLAVSMSVSLRSCPR